MINEFIDASAVLGSGIYALTLRGEIVYIGQSRVLCQRIGQHKEPSKRGGPPNYLIVKRIKFDGVLVFPCAVENLDKLEREMIQRHQPKCNERLLGPQPKITERLELMIGGTKIVLNDSSKNAIKRRHFVEAENVVVV